ncbi:MAG: 5'-nucleotidase C-terminal domain-containing protein [Halothiobacillaceae bacterium]|nr:5'-nucleotidase C-terminal domain-containing protein [Halothiobacillaceae bacterium]
MRKSALWLALLPAAALLLHGCNDSDSTPVTKPLNLTLLHTNDTHSHLESFQPSGEPVQGGVARRLTAIESVKAQVGAGRVLTVDAGDFMQGSLFYNAWKGSADIMGLNALGYDVATLGNHEFDLGPVELGRALRGEPVSINGVSYTTEKPKFPLVVTNLDVSKEPALNGLLKKSLVVEREGEKIGVLGVVTDTISTIASPGPNVKILDYVASVQAEADSLKASGVNKIVLLSHYGYKIDVDNAKKLAGVDVIVSGHDHALLGDKAAFAADPRLKFMANRIVGSYPTVTVDKSGDTTLIVSSYEWGRWLGRLDVNFDEHGRVKSWNQAPVFIDETVAENATLKARVAEWKKPVDALSKVEIGSAAMFFDGNRDSVRGKETELGNLVADVMLASTRQSDGAVAALTNGGGLRASINPGVVTFGDALSVLPFGNTIAVVEVTGSELIQSLDNGLSWAYDPVKNTTASSGAFPQIAGMQVGYCGGTLADIQAKQLPPRACPNALQAGGLVNALSVAGKPVDPQARYRLATNNFVAGGGDFYSAIGTACKRAGGYCRDTGVIMLDALVDEFEVHSPLSRQVEGRLYAN